MTKKITLFFSALLWCVLAISQATGDKLLTCEGQEYKVDAAKVIWQKIGGTWTTIGNNCAELTCNRRRVFCKGMNGGLFRYNGVPNNWSDANILLPGQELNAGTVSGQEHFLMSHNGRYMFYMQQNGDLGLWDHIDAQPKAIWSSKTATKENCTLMMQTDGNLVAYDKNKVPIWSTATHSSVNPQYAQDKYKGVLFALEDDGRLVLYAKDLVPIWDNVKGKYPLEASNVPKLPRLEIGQTYTFESVSGPGLFFSYGTVPGRVMLNGPNRAFKVVAPLNGKAGFVSLQPANASGDLYVAMGDPCPGMYTNSNYYDVKAKPASPDNSFNAKASFEVMAGRSSPEDVNMVSLRVRNGTHFIKREEGVFMDAPGESAPQYLNHFTFRFVKN